MKDKAIVPLFLPVMYTLCNSKKSCDRTGGREALCPYCDKKKPANSHLCFLLHCPVSPRFSSRFIPNALSHCPTEAELQLLLGVWSNEVKQYQQPLFLLSQRGFIPVLLDP